MNTVLSCCSCHLKKSAFGISNIFEHPTMSALIFAMEDVILKMDNPKKQLIPLTEGISHIICGQVTWHNVAITLLKLHHSKPALFGCCIGTSAVEQVADDLAFCFSPVFRMAVNGGKQGLPACFSKILDDVCSLVQLEEMTGGESKKKIKEQMTKRFNFIITMIPCIRVLLPTDEQKDDFLESLDIDTLCERFPTVPRLLIFDILEAITGFKAHKSPQNFLWARVPPIWLRPEHRQHKSGLGPELSPEEKELRAAQEEANMIQDAVAKNETSKQDAQKPSHSLLLSTDRLHRRLEILNARISGLCIEKTETD